jgi:hypothetical protein
MFIRHNKNILCCFWPKRGQFCAKTRFRAKPFQRAQICEDRLSRTGVQRGQKTANNKYDSVYIGQRYKWAQNNEDPYFIPVFQSQKNWDFSTSFSLSYLDLK